MTRPFVRAFLPMWLVLGATMLVAQHTAAPKPTTGRAETPSQFYLRYRSAVQSASNLDDVTRFWQKSLVAEFKVRFSPRMLQKSACRILLEL